MKTQIILIHGGETFDSYEAYLKFLKNFELDLALMNRKGWKDTLGPALGDDYEIIAPRMPNSWNAKYIEWKIWFEKYLSYIQDNAIFIGNSLGGIFLAKYFAENEYTKPVKRIFLVAAPHDPVNEHDSLADFILPTDMSRLATYGNKVHLYYSKDDPIVAFADLEKYKRELPNAHIRELDGRGHFMVEEFPELVADIKALC